MGLAGRYTIELFKGRGEGSGIEAVIDSDDRLDAARSLCAAMMSSTALEQRGNGPSSNVRTTSLSASGSFRM